MWGRGDPIGLETPQAEGSGGVGGLQMSPTVPQPPRRLPAGCGGQQPPGSADSITGTTVGPDSPVLMRRGGPSLPTAGALGQGVCRANEPHRPVKRPANNVNSRCRGEGDAFEMQSSPLAPHPPHRPPAAAPPRQGSRDSGTHCSHWGRAPAVGTATLWGRSRQRQGWEKRPGGLWAPPPQRCTPTRGASCTPSPGPGEAWGARGWGRSFPPAGASSGWGGPPHGGLPPTAAGHLPLPSPSPSSPAPLPRAPPALPRGGGSPRQVSQAGATPAPHHWDGVWGETVPRERAEGDGAACPWVGGSGSRGRAVCAHMYVCIGACINGNVHPSLCVCVCEHCARLRVGAGVARGEGPSRSARAGYVKEQPEPPRASHPVARRWPQAPAPQQYLHCSPSFPGPRRLAATRHGLDAGVLGAETRQRVSSGPGMARLGSAGQDALAGGEAGGGAGRQVPRGSRCWAGRVSVPVRDHEGCSGVRHGRAAGMAWGRWWVGVCWDCLPLPCLVPRTPVALWGVGEL